MSSSRASHSTISLVFLFLLFLEPIGGSIPKFSGITHLTGLLGKSSQPLTITCPAQGSPVPSFRCVVLNIHYHSLNGFRLNFFPNLKGFLSQLTFILFVRFNIFCFLRTNWGLSTKSDSDVKALTDDLWISGVLVTLLSSPGIPHAKF